MKSEVGKVYGIGNPLIFGCRHFSQTNILLRSEGKTPINWQL